MIRSGSRCVIASPVNDGREALSAPQARFAAENVSIIGRRTEFVRTSDEDGERRTFRFCPACGATVYYTTGDSADTIAVPVGAFADPAFPPPKVSVYEIRRHPWVAVPEDAEHFD